VLALLAYLLIGLALASLLGYWVGYTEAAGAPSWIPMLLKFFAFGGGAIFAVAASYMFVRWAMTRRQLRDRS